MSAIRSAEATRHSDSSATGIRALGLILLAGLVVRLGLWLWFAPLPPQIADEQDYTRLAVNLLEHGEFAFSPGSPTSLRPPLYAVFVAGVYAVAGIDNYQAVRLVQALLSLVNVWLVYRLGREAFSHRVGLWAAGLCAFYPGLLGSNNLILTEVLFTLLLTAACYLVVLYYTRKKVSYLALAGVLLGLTALTRSVVWLSPPFLAVYVVITGNRSLAHRVLGAALLVMAFSATIAPWTIRNTQLQKTFVTIDTMGGRNFLMGNYEHTPLYRSWDAISIQGEKSWEQEVFPNYPPEMRRTQGQVDKLALRQGLKFVGEHPGLTAMRDLIKFFDFWGLERELIAGATRGYFGPVPGPVVLTAGALMVLSYAGGLFLGIFGGLFSPPGDRRVHWYFLLVIAFICGLHTVVFGHSRYHLPLMPLVLLYAAAAWTNRSTLWERWRSARFVLALVLCLVFVIGWAWNAIAGDWALVQGVLGKPMQTATEGALLVVNCR
jgi:4-amino-4-deoxy-L-arabinose transferase-like glycosyltransferase